MMIDFTPELAYIGPGAGFAFLGSFLTLLGGLLLGLLSVLMWPFRMAVRAPHAGSYGQAHGNAWAGVPHANALYEADDCAQAEHLLNIYLPLAT